MAKIIDLRQSGGQLVVIGDAIALPNSNAATFTNNVPMIAGSIRYNNLTNVVEYLSNQSMQWLPCGIDNSDVPQNVYVAKSGDIMTGTLMMPNAVVSNTTTTQFLIVSNSATINSATVTGTLTVAQLLGNSATLTNATISNLLTANALTVTGPTTLSGPLTVNGNMSYNQPLSVLGPGNNLRFSFNNVGDDLYLYQGSGNGFNALIGGFQTANGSTMAANSVVTGLNLSPAGGLNLVYNGSAIVGSPVAALPTYASFSPVGNQFNATTTVSSINPGLNFYNGSLQVREALFVANTQTSIQYAPCIGFNWQNVSSAQIFMSNTSEFYFSTSASRSALTNIHCAYMFGTATSALYADLAERYAADQPYVPGTVVILGGTAEITACSSVNDHRVAGVISTDPAFMMNREAGDDSTHPYVALRGRVPCRVFGQIRKGDLLVTSDSVGCAQAAAPDQINHLVGKAMQDWDGGFGIIEIMV